MGKKAAQRRIKRVSEDEEDHVIVPFEKKKDEICINQFPEARKIYSRRTW